MFKSILLLFRKHRYRAGRRISQFIARDVRRDIEVISNSRLEEGFITVRTRTTNILYQMSGLVAKSEFDGPREVAIADLWHWTGKSWGGLPDGTSLVGTHHLESDLKAET